MTAPKPERKTECPMFCVCNFCTSLKASSHADADRDCGRAWSCQCGACRITRKEPKVMALFEVHQAFGRIERLERLRAVMKS